MLLNDALSQLAILGATSIVLRSGRVVELDQADLLREQTDRSTHFVLCAKGHWVEVLDALTGRVFGKAMTLWSHRANLRLAVGG